MDRLTGQAWEVMYVDAEEESKIGTEKLSKGDFSGAVHLVRYVKSVGGCSGDYTLHAGCVNQQLSLPKDNPDEVVAALVKV